MARSPRVRMPHRRSNPAKSGSSSTVTGWRPRNSGDPPGGTSSTESPAPSPSGYTPAASPARPAASPAASPAANRPSATPTRQPPRAPPPRRRSSWPRSSRRRSTAPPSGGEGAHSRLQHLHPRAGLRHRAHHALEQPRRGLARLGARHAQLRAAHHHRPLRHARRAPPARHPPPPVIRPRPSSAPARHRSGPGFPPGAG